MHTGGNNLCGFVIIRGLQSANVIPQSVSSTTNLYGFSRMHTEGNQREFLFYMSFYNKRSKPIEEHLCNLWFVLLLAAVESFHSSVTFIARKSCPAL